LLANFLFKNTDQKNRVADRNRTKIVGDAGFCEVYFFAFFGLGLQGLAKAERGLAHSSVILLFLNSLFSVS
jgi:hypothetical protein